MKIIGTITFNLEFDLKTSKTDLTERDFNESEKELYQIRKIVLEELMTNTERFFKFYNDTKPNIIPIISGQEKKVYVLTGPQKNGVVIFGNDYLIKFDKNNKIVSKKELHKNIIPIKYGGLENGKIIEGSMHNHLSETGDLILATDICTLMLYEKFTKWKTHTVMSEKYISIWNCETNQLSIKPINKEGKEK